MFAQTQGSALLKVEQRVLATRSSAKSHVVREAECRVIIEAGKLLVPPSLWVFESEKVLSDAPAFLLDAYRMTGCPQRLELSPRLVQVPKGVIACMQADFMSPFK